ncbi:MAG: hydrogenase expression/formation protein HypE [Myxococcota bacterium]
MSRGPMQLECPIPDRGRDRIEMAHGGGGRAMRELISGLFRRHFDSPHLAAETDAAVLPVAGSRVAFTTDTYVVQPLFFAGADIGKLAVCGTVNDLATSGAVPRYLSCGFILEEGLEREVLERVVRSMAETAREAGVAIVTGDTKVVERSRGDGLYVNTAGVGDVPPGVELGPAQLQPGDQVLVTGDIGRHGVAVMAARDSLFGFDADVQSDCAPLAGLVRQLVESGVGLRCLRDLTRGGLGAALHELAEHRCLGLVVDERSVPVLDPVQGACELLGLDPMFVANEGRMLVVTAADDADQALELLRAHPDGAGAARIGEVVTTHPGSVTVTGLLGTDRVLDLPLGEQLPRIC